jgi:hypothetical protein
MIKRLLLAGLAALVILSGRGHQALAAGPSGVTVSPAFQQVSIAGGEAAHDINFTVINNEAVPQTFNLSVADFNTLGESGGLFFVGTNPTTLQKKYGLAKWVSLPQDSLTLQPGQSQTITAQVLNLPDLSPGGHYGALMLAAQSPGQAAGSNGVSIHPIASSLLFVTKVGGDTHALGLVKVSSDRNLLKLPSQVALRFHNTGNTHVIPRGVVKLTTAGGKVVSQGVINEDSNIILPETYRQIIVPLSKFDGGNAVTKYHLTVDYRVDGISLFREYRSSFWYIDNGFVAGIIIIAAAALVLAYKKHQRPNK